MSVELVQKAAITPRQMFLFALYLGLLFAPIIVPPIFGIHFFEKSGMSRNTVILLVVLIYLPVSCVLAARWAKLSKRVEEVSPETECSDKT